MRVLNLYAGLGGNRKLWEGCEVIAVESHEKIAEIYQRLHPNDGVIVGDAHEYLRQNFRDFDFIWSSPPCQTHSSFRFNIGVRYRGVEAKFPDMSLYEEILFLQYHSKVLWVVENVVPYYKPFLDPTRIGRHLYWSNFELPDTPHLVDKIRGAQIPDLQNLHGYDLSKYKLPNKRQVLRNVVSPQVGLDILEAAKNSLLRDDAE